MKTYTVLTLALAAAFIIGGSAYADDGMMCAQVITYGLNPDTLEWEIFSTPCEVPDGWRASMTRPDAEPLDDDVVVNPGDDGIEEPLVIAPYDPDIETDPVEEEPVVMPVIAPYNPDPVIAPYNPDEAISIPAYTFTDADDGKTVTVETGAVVRVTLESNPSTGYQWAITALDENILKNTDNAYTSECSEGMMGCGGKETWDFAPLSPGTTTLEMAYLRSWEGADSAIETFSLNVEVTAAPETDASSEEPFNPPYDPEIALSVNLACDADANGDGVTDQADLSEKRRAMNKDFNTWKKECWRARTDCGDYDEDGEVTRRDLIKKRKDKDIAFKTWKESCWVPGTKLQSGETNNIGKQAKISECGGFAENDETFAEDDGNAEKDATFAHEDDNCRDERLVWTYDQALQTVTFLNQNVHLNCCGERSVTLSQNAETGVYEIYETDTPEMVGDTPSRCRCMCFFDFQVALPDVAPGVIQVALFRSIAENKEPLSAIWKGELSLGNIQGDELVAENVGWCYEEPTCLDEEICGNGIDDNCDHQIDEGCGEVCGGIMGLACPQGQFCLFDEDTCEWRDNMGQCMVVPEFCIELYAPVCGCDGNTYGNECFMMMAGQSKLHDGLCEKD